MKIFIITFILIFYSIIYSQNIIVKKFSNVKNYKNSIPQLDLYLIDQTKIPRNYEYIEKNYKLKIQSSENYIDPENYKQNYLKYRHINSNNKINIALLDSGVNFKHNDIIGFGDNDINGHGTSIAGIICAISNNNIGISGISNCNLYSLRITNKNGIGTYFKLAKKIVECVENNYTIICIPNGGIHYSKALKESIEYAVNNGCYIIAAGGNTNSKKILYPANYKNVISVGSINNENLRCTVNDWGFNKKGIPLGSCYGKNVDVFALGTNIYSTNINGDYDYFNGTSYSCAIITGIAANILSEYPDILLSNLKNKINTIINYKNNDHIQKKYINNNSSNIKKIGVIYKKNYNASVNDNILSIKREFSKNPVFPKEDLDITITIKNISNSTIQNFEFTELINSNITVQETSEVYIGSAVIDVNYTKSKNENGYIPYIWSFNNLEVSQSIVIKYFICAEKSKIYYFNKYRWKGKYETIDLSGQESNGDILIAQMPDISEDACPCGEISDMNPIFKWKSAGSGFNYILSLYEINNGKLILKYKNKEINTNSFNWTDSGKILENGKTYIWKVKGIYGKKYTSTVTLKFIPYNYDAPYQISPIGKLYSTNFPNFNWTLINKADHYEIKIYKKIKLFNLMNNTKIYFFKTKKIASYSTEGNTSEVSLEKISETIGENIEIEPDTNYFWKIKAVSKDNDKISSKWLSSDFEYYPISEPVLMSPIDSTTEVETNKFTFKWKIVENADKYIFKLYKLYNNNYILIPNSVKETANTSTEYSLEPLTNYKWQIIPVKNNMNGSSTYAKFSTIPGNPPKLISPSKTSTSLTPTLSWDSNYKNVRIEIFNSKNKKIVDVNTGNYDNYLNLSNISNFSLETGKKYKVLLRAEYANNKLYTKWSKKYFYTAYFDKPTIISPIQSSNSLNPEFKWSEIENADKYKIIIKKKSDNKTILTKEINTNSYIYNKEDANNYELKANKYYKFKVCALTSNLKEGRWSKFNSFKALNLSTPIIKTPDSTTLLKNILFSWEPVDNADSYKWSIREYSGKKQLIAQGNTTNTSYYFGSNYTEYLKNDTKYKFKLWAIKNLENKTIKSNPSSTKFISYALENVYTISPGYNNEIFEIIDTLSPEFKWSENSNSEYYELFLYDINKKIKKYYYIFDSASYTLPIKYKLKNDHEYYFQVRAINNYGFSQWSEKNYFKTELISSPVLTHPIGEIYSNSPTFVLNMDNKAIKAEIVIYKYSNNEKIIYKKIIVKRNQSIGSAYSIIYPCNFLLPLDQKYCWKARSISINGKSDYSDTMDFELTNTAYSRNESMQEIFSTVRAIYSNSITQNSAYISWTVIPQTLNYHIYINNNEYNSTSNNNITISSLSANTLYSIEVAAEDSTGIGDRSVPYSLLTLPDEVTDITTSDINVSGVKLLWTAKQYAKKYYIYKNGTIDSISATNEVYITGMLANTEYSFKISAENISGEGLLSSSITAKTLPAEPFALTASNIGSTDFKLSWNAPSGGADNYQIYINNSAYNSPVATTFSEISELSINTVYAIQVSSIGESGESSRSTILNVVTLPNTVQNLVCYNKTSYSVSLSWDNVSNTIRYYIYVNGNEYSSSTENSSIVIDLDSNTEYQFQVVSENISGKGELSEILTVKTLPEGPKELSASKHTTSSFKISWIPPESGANSYQLYIDNEKYGSTTTSTSMIVENLNPNTIYSIEIASITDEGEGSRSFSLSARTLPDVPTDITISDKTSSSFKVSWSAPSGEAINLYKVYINGIGTTTSNNFMTITGLSSNTTYTIKVSGVIDEGEGNISNTINVTTL